MIRTLRPISLGVAFAVLLVSGQRANGQQSSLGSPLAIAQDAIKRVADHTANNRPPDADQTISVDALSSRTALRQLHDLLGSTVTASELDNPFPTLKAEPSDSVVRCSSRDGREAAWCSAVTPRNVARLLSASRGDDLTLVVTVSVLQWTKPSPVQTPGFDVLLEYKRGALGEWSFSKILGFRAA